MALRHCRDDTKALAQPDLPDPFASHMVYVPLGCNDSQAPVEKTADLETKSASLRDLEEKLDQLEKVIKRKDEMLRVRNNQLVEASATLESREALWNSSLHSVPLSHHWPVPDTLAPCTQAQSAQLLDE